ncbi:glycogen debranching enzyme isoform X2 [Anthonomus grandis grandis]|uniref:glycogen debranching enzyme isoform X2 n=1 Tax=Anthonomus grandis grandis TaxID=2921223 RepID=UPI002166B984|nr:glycogen debranching enzyme isoform X2 [Anthonomus grandis grandis]
MLVIFLCSVIVLIFLFLVFNTWHTTRIRSKMSSLFSWLLGTVSGTKSESNTSEARSSQAVATARDTKQPKPKAKQRVKKPNNEPAFSTKLETPIEQVIEETLKEENTEKKSKKKNKNCKKSKVDEPENEEFVFVKEGTSKSPAVIDDVGYSFFPVKDRSRKGKKSILEKKSSEEAITAVIAQGISKKKDPVRPAIIDHYKKPLLIEKPKVELKESKKVTSKVSYASIVTNSEPSNNEIFKEVNKNSAQIVSQSLENPVEVAEVARELQNSPGAGGNEFINENLIICEESVITEVPSEVATIPRDPGTLVVNQNPLFSEVKAVDSEEVNAPETNLSKEFINQELLVCEKISLTETSELESNLKEELEITNQDLIVCEKITLAECEDHPKQENNQGLLFCEEEVTSTSEELNEIKADPSQENIEFSDKDLLVCEKIIVSEGESSESKLRETVNDFIDGSYVCEEVVTSNYSEESSEVKANQKGFENYIANLESTREEIIISGVSPKDFIEAHIEDQASQPREPSISENIDCNHTENQIREITKEETQIVENILKEYSNSDDIILNGFHENDDTVIDEKTDETLIREINTIEHFPVEKKDNYLTDNMSEKRILALNDKEHLESTIYRIEKNFTLQFRLGPSLLGRKIKLYCNYPKERANGTLEEFDRNRYQLLSWCQDEGCKNSDDTASFAEIKEVNVAGSFHYYFVYDNEDTEEKQGSGYFLVDPVLQYGNKDTLPLDCIQCQTVLAKHLGPISTWENKLRVAKESGYNMVHFTPIQQLGVSKSCYSLSEQLKLNPSFSTGEAKQATFEDVEKLISKMRKEWKVLSVCDIVLNHTANESEWIKEHPEATYNCLNCPYLRPAYLLDAAFHHFSMDIKKGYYEDRGIPAEISTEEHLNAFRYHFKTAVLEPLRLQELFIADVNKILEQFLTLARKTPPVTNNERDHLPDIQLIQDPEFKRLMSKIDLNSALKKYNTYRSDCFDEESRVKRCTEDLKSKLDSLNDALIKELQGDLDAAVENVIAGIRYFRVQPDGPKIREITTKNPVVYRYFTDHGSPQSLKEAEETMYSEDSKFIMAHNGWVMNSDPLKNFADAGTKTYIRRDLIAWGDSVKLRFGDKPEDSPYLWNHMRKYVEQTVKIFDGVRLDNCHSTPIPVAEYLLDCARKVRPDLFVVAELFTNSDLTDNIFVNRLGITSLIREAMSAWDSHEQGRLVYRYGGVPVGSFEQPRFRLLTPMVAHALFLDLTHDNPSPVEKRSVFDLLPSTALVNMACCASGSNRGYDELVPHHIHVVDETRQYTEWSEDESQVIGNVRYVNDRFGIIAAKRALNNLHFKLGSEGFNQVYVDQMDADIVAVTRHNPKSHVSYILVAFTAFGHPDVHAGNYQRSVKPLRVEGVLQEIVLEASLSHVDVETGGSKYTKFGNFVKDSKWINGLSEYRVSLKQHIAIDQSDFLEEANSGSPNILQLNFKNFKPGSVVVIKVSLHKEAQESVSKLRTLINTISVKKDRELSQIISKMNLCDLNRALYRCDQEERDDGLDVYNIPNFGPVVYCGLQGFNSILANIRSNNDLGHPFCGNLRDGNWMIDYIWKRLKVDQGTKELGQWIEENTKPFRGIPRYLIPCYFDLVFDAIHTHLLRQSWDLMSDFSKNGSAFVRQLSLGSLQFGGYVKSANLPTLSPNLAPPKPRTRKNDKGESVQACVTLSAGLPHFSVGYMRNWGRDTFIAMRGLFLLTGRFEEAREHILGYAACLRHGLIPNLLDGGRNSRFNCRDALWWWLYCIKSYCEDAPNGTAILNDLVSRIFPKDDSPPQPPGSADQPLCDVIQEALNVHFQGLKFRERNAGRQIDEHMTDAGFNNQIGIHPETGFVFGGNQWNCGTWMDKMGSSDKAGNRGKPATPRDGSAVELIGLSKAAVSWLAKLHGEGKYPYDGVQRTHKNGAVTKWTFKEWADKIQQNFEKKFWIAPKPTAEEPRPDLINKKSIYKDCFGSSQPWTDYQLRCNFPIAMVAAPELFNPQHAWAALGQAEKYLLGPLGMKTLDPEDWNYRGDYDNSNDSDDFHVANGFNYHQGPEWVWPIGFFLRAKLLFASQNGMLKETISNTKVILSKHMTELTTSAWRGLPELTNSNGSYCRDSSRTQAWSMSCVLEVLYDLQQIESKQVIVN